MLNLELFRPPRSLMSQMDGFYFLFFLLRRRFQSSDTRSKSYAPFLYTFFQEITYIDVYDCSGPECPRY